MEKITIFLDDCDNLLIAYQEDGLPVKALLVAKQDSTGTLHGDLDMFDGKGYGAVYDGPQAAMMMLRVWGQAFAEISDRVKPLRRLDAWETAYLGIQ